MPLLLIEVAKKKSKVEPSLFGQRLRQFRSEAKVSQRKLAELTGVHYVTIANLETGETQQPVWDIAQKLATALGKTLNDFTSPPEE